MRTLAFISLLIMSSFTFGENLEDIRWISEQYPPYNYVDPDDGKPKGVTFDILMVMFDRLSVDVAPEDIEFLPWARSYRDLQNEPQTALFSMTYTPEREKLFEFVGPIIPSKITLMAPKSAGVSVDSVEEMNQLQIGAIRDDIGEQLLLSKGVDPGQIQLSSKTDALIRKLQAGRIDAIAYGQDIALWTMKSMGMNPNEYESVFTLADGQMGYAFHKDTDPALLSKLQKTLDELIADGTVQSISDEYLK
ncbi:transporter substrate-binding domain-containing protein [Marinobacter sp. CHS3-4]|uniref:substrate-binding periplasmic protein n=1 Tax=Marinobacter sp. CHS3-4 TaxID=3045174 RepID=UPI0024B5FD05|nr:transporter substrate-binding domain-containing protein [Marinobacter sp. CHS3-4]MDI9245370.1 transporter substrate-binding domain-containing protein [Marinobacter sp. CHS3-4]